MLSYIPTLISKENEKLVIHVASHLYLLSGNTIHAASGLLLLPDNPFLSKVKMKMRSSGVPALAFNRISDKVRLPAKFKHII
jgi:hypothetical protein